MSQVAVGDCQPLTQTPAIDVQCNYDDSHPQLNIRSFASVCGDVYTASVCGYVYIGSVYSYGLVKDYIESVECSMPSQWVTRRCPGLGSEM